MAEPRIIIPRLLGSCRFNIVMLCLWGSFVPLFCTINLGMAIVCMQKRPPLVNGTLTNQLMSQSNCSVNSTSVDYVIEASNCTAQADDLIWDRQTQGMLLSAPYYGMVTMQLITGWLCDKFGRNKLQMVVGIGVLGTASALSPAMIHLGVPYFFVLRIVKGTAMGLSLSSILPLLTHWTTSQEQGLLVSLAFAGISLANALTYPVSALLCQYGGWTSIFYFACGIGLLWMAVALFLLHDKPLTHPRIDAEEKQYLLTYVARTATKDKEKVDIPWFQILTSVPVWSVIVTNFLFFAAIKGLIINLPLFIRDLLDFTITENGVFSSLPAVCALVCRLLTGPVFDWAHARNRFSLTVIRKLFHVVGTLFPAALMFTVSQLHPDQKYAIIALITIGYALTEVASVAGFTFTLMDIAPRFVGVLQGINNSIGLAPGFIMPLVIAALTPNGSREEWSSVFLIFGGLFSLATITFVVTGSSERQKWSDPEPKEVKPLTSVQSI